MHCFCGCGIKVSRKLTDANLQASQVALELLSWDKARTANTSPGPMPADTEALIDRGARCYRRLLASLHGESGDDPTPEAQNWLRDSLDARRNREDMTEKRSFFFTAPKLKLTEMDISRLDRARPERSFSAAAPERADEDPVAQLKGLRELHAAGALTDDEFAEAKARVIGSLGSDSPAI